MKEQKSLYPIPAKIRKKLIKNEEVFHFADNLKIDNAIEVFLFVFFSIIIIASAIFLKAITAIFLLLIVFITLVFTLLYLIRVKKQRAFLVFSSHGIRMYQKFIPWESVFDIRFRLNNENQNILVFHLSSNIIEPYLDLLEVNTSFHLNDTIILGGSYLAEELYNQLFPYWNPNAPTSKLEQIGDQLSTQYAFREYQPNPHQQGYQGKFKNSKIKLSYDREFPFRSTRVLIKLNKPLAFYLSIHEETSKTKLKQQLGIKDIQVGWIKTDEKYNFQCSDPNGLKHMLTTDLIIKLERLILLGTVNWTFGKPLTGKRLRSNKSKIKDEENILDSSLLEIQQPFTFQYASTKQKTVIEGLINKSFVQPNSELKWTEDPFPWTFYIPPISEEDIGSFAA